MEMSKPLGEWNTPPFMAWVAITGSLLVGPHLEAEQGQGMHPYPLWPSEPVPGWPGVGADEEHTVEKIQELIQGRPSDPRPAIYGQPEFQAYPGAVHHLRRDLQRYVPPYPMCNAKTLVKNFVLNQMAGHKGRCVEFAEPVYYNPMYRPRIPTKQRCPAVRAYPWKPGSAPIKLELGKLKQSMYVIRPICAAPGVTAVWPATCAWVKLRINDLPNDPETMNGYELLGRVIDNFYVVQDFYFQSRGDGRTFRAELSLLAKSDRDVLLYNIDLHDRFAELAKRRGKKRTTLTDVEKRRARWEENRKKNAKQWARLQKQNRTPEDQKHFDDLVWRLSLPPMNALYANGRGIQFYDFKNMTRDSLLRAPAEWERLVSQYDLADAPGKDRYILFTHGHARPKGPLFIAPKDGKLYFDRSGYPHVDPPRYEVRDALVYRQAVKEADAGGGKKRKQVVPGELLGELAELDPASVKSGRITTLKDATGAEIKPQKAWIEGKFYEDGKLVDDKPRRISYFTRFYDKRLRNGLSYEREIEPGLYYDARTVMCLMRAGLFHRDVRWTGAIGSWLSYGHRQNVRDQAMKFVRLVYQLSSLRVSHDIALIKQKEGPDRQPLRHYQRAPEGRYLIPFYDAIFEFVSTDKEFATAVGRYLPWVKTPDDVVELIDTRLVQDYANRMMKYRYFYDHGQAALLLTAVTVQDDSSISDPWMEFLFTRGWEYPQALSGLGDNLVTGSTRDGGTTIGSFAYALGGHTKTTELLETYIRNGGNRKYDLTDPRQYPSTRLHPYLVIEGNAAGRINPGIGDVGGPAEYYARFATAPSVIRAGWRWHRDPKFAWDLVNTHGRGGETDEEWAEIEAAAKRCPRDPFLMNRSRALTGWGAYITSGVEHDDFRLRREAALRIGTGWGHAHHDTLDLRLFAFGCTMSGDFNQRPAYGWPPHWKTRCHNVVEVDGKDWMSHAWVRNLFDAPGSSYVSAESVAPYGLEHVKLFRRQVALVDVEDSRSSALQSGVEAGQQTGPTTNPERDPDASMPSLYVFDVFRVSGGTTHTYCFHGCVDDVFEANVKRRRLPTPDENSPDRGYLAPFRWNVEGDRKGREGPDYWVGKCAGRDLTATWGLARKSEEYMLAPGRPKGGVLTPERKYTRLTLLNQRRSTILHAIARHKGGEGYYGRCLYAQKNVARRSAADLASERAPGLESVFVALIEPYAGEPSITEQRQLKILDNDGDALDAVAVEVGLNSGRTDLLFTDGRPDRTRTVITKRGFLGKGRETVTVAAEYAYLSHDEHGLRQATLTGGARLSAPGISIEVGVPRYDGLVTEVDYLDRKATVEGAIPGRLSGHTFEVGNDLHKTSYETSKIESDGDRTVITMRKGLEIMRTRVREADPKTGKVIGSIAMFRRRGRDAGLVGSDDNLTKFWRVAYSGGDRHAGHEFTLTAMDPEADGPAFTREDFPSGAGLRVWEFGVGDTVGIQTGVSVRRLRIVNRVVVYEVFATSPCRLTPAGACAAWSPDGKTWQALAPDTQTAQATFHLTETLLGARRRIYLKVGD